MSHRNRKAALMGGLVTALALAGAAQTAQAAPHVQKAVPGDAASSSSTGQERRDHFDSRSAGANAKALQHLAAVHAAKPKSAVLALKKQLGSQGIVSIDALTGSPRQIARTNGFLTGPSSLAPKTNALAYVRAHKEVFGLDAGALRALQLRKSWTDIDGSHHLSFVQQVAGIPVFGNGIVAHVAKDGRIIGFTGSPLTSVSGLGSAVPGISADAARAAAIKGAGGDVRAAKSTLAAGATRQVRFAGGDRTQLVWFKTVGATVLAWQAQVTTSDGLYNSVVDARTGRVLYRNALSASDTARVWDYYPGAPKGGVQREVTLPQSWLPNNSVVLQGNNAHVFTDVNDDDAASQSEEIRRSSKGHFDFTFKTFPSNVAGISCTSAYPCSWDPTRPNSWRTNARQNATQVFYYVNRFHDHLSAAPIGFTRAAGSFTGDDPVDTQPLDGADTDNGLPDPNHIDNANMSTPPDGQSPTMQMYLFHQPGATVEQDPFLMANGGDDAGIVYHEYTHGLSNRLVIDANGNSTLGNLQSGAMGEAWSDWYAEDFLVNKGFVTDTQAAGDVRVGQYVGAGQDLIRFQPLDCPVGSTSAKCPGLPGKPGGFTYGDYGHIFGTPEVHADGEIWGETLWDLRHKLGSKATESLVTRAMTLSPSNPSFLDERNAILQADVVQGGKRQQAIWSVFAARGMGYFASVQNGDDSTPIEDFSLPPTKSTPKGDITGTVTDDRTHAGLPGAVVSVAGHASAPGFFEYLAATTNAAGKYTIKGAFYGTYHDVSADKPGYDFPSADITVRAPSNTLNFALKRDWAAADGGAGISRFNGPDFTPACGPLMAIDRGLGTGWGSTSADNGPFDWTITPKYVIVKLPRAINVNGISVDPSNTCGDPGSASTQDYRVETTTVTTPPSAGDPSWKLANSGSFTIDNRGHLNPLKLAAGTGTGVTYVKFTMLRPQVPGDFATTCTAGGFAGCEFMDMTELTVYGAPAT